MGDTAVDADFELRAINVIRGLAMDGPAAANSGHQGTAMALAPLAHVLFTRILRYDAIDDRLANPPIGSIVSSNGPCRSEVSCRSSASSATSMVQRPGSRVWISCSSQALPSGSLKEAKEE